MKKSIWIFLLSLFILFPSISILIPSSRASEKAVLLYSLAMMSPEEAAADPQADIFFRIKSEFIERFENLGLEISIQTQADQSHLFQALNSSDSIAVMWISHGSSAGTPAKGLRKAGIFDWRGFDVTPVLQKTHPNLISLAVIACGSKDVVDYFVNRSENGMSNSPIAFTHSVRLEAAFNQALDEMEKQISSTLRIEITRRAEPSQSQSSDSKPFFSALRVEDSQGRVLGTLPAAQSDEVQMLRTRINPKTALSLTVTSGQNGLANHSLNEIGKIEIYTIHGPTRLRWSAFSPKGSQAHNLTRKVFFPHPDHLTH